MNQNQEHNESDFQKFIKQHSHISDNWPDWEKNALGEIDELYKRIQLGKSRHEQSHDIGCRHSHEDV